MCQGFESCHSLITVIDKPVPTRNVFSDLLQVLFSQGGMNSQPVIFEKMHLLFIRFGTFAFMEDQFISTLAYFTWPPEQ
jgi:hypothetical protein